MSDTPDTIWTVLSSCSVCGKTLDKDSSPQLLPCCHSSCKECIQDNRNHLSDVINTNRTDKPEFKCKICLQEYCPDECIDNDFQKLYWSRNKWSETQICQSCDGENKSAVIKCKTCDWICEDCQTLHKTIKVFKGHELDESTKISFSEDMTKNVCFIHNEEKINVYCKTCRAAYCYRCILKDHNLHVFEDTKDNIQLNSFYDILNKKVDSIKEKRSFAENTLQKFETIETDISGQREQCIQKIKTIVNKLQEKISELGTTLLDKVNAVCQKKEQEFNQKKNQLRQLNDSFKYTEGFIAAILALNDPMAVMKAQDLLNTQLQKLLNKPCSHPDFITPFKIEVTDALSEGQKDGQNFNVGKMIDGVFNMCFKIVTTDDPKEVITNSNPVNTEGNSADEEISIIGGVTNSSTPPTRPFNLFIQTTSQQTRFPNKPQTVFRTAAPVSSGIRTIIRGNSNKELSKHLFGTNSHLNNSYANQMQLQYQSASRPMSNSLSVPPQRLTQAHNALANSMPSTQSVSQNNFMPQTGILTSPMAVPYGSPQVFRGPVTNQSVQNVSIPIVTGTNNYSYMDTMTIPPNVTIYSNQQLYNSPIRNVRPAQTRSTTAPSYGSGPTSTQTSCQMTGTTQPTVVYPVANAQPQTPPTNHQTIIKQLAQTVNSIPSQQSGQLASQQILQRQRLELQKQRDIQIIEQHLKDSSNALIGDPLAQRSSNTNATNATNAANASASTGQPLPTPDRTYELHIPDNTTITPIPSETERSSQSGTSNSSVPVTTPSTTSIQSVQNPNSCLQTHSIDSNNQTAGPATPTTSQVVEPTAEKSPETTKENCNQSGNAVETTTPVTDSSEEVIVPHLSNPPSVNSLFSELSNDVFADIETNCLKNREENRENISSGGRSAATPVARIAPITSETENSSIRSELVDLRGDDLSDDESIDEDADCVVCSKEYGEFICCSKCPRAFHCECHVPELKKMPETAFTCTFCQSTDQMLPHSRGRKSGLNDRQQRISEKLLLHLLCHKKSYDFKPPASDNIQQNINLNTIKKKLENKEFETEIQLIDDIKRLFSRYKSRNITPEVMEDYNTFERYFKKVVHKLMPTFSEALQNNTLIHNSDSSGGSASKKTKSNCVSI